MIFRTTTKLRSDDTAGFMRLSVLHYHLGEAEESLNEVRECLRLDPDHKDCFTLYKKYGYYGTVGNDDQPSRKQLLERSLLLMPARSGDLS